MAKATTVTTNFLGHSVITDSGVLGNTATDNSATNVGIQLLEDSTTGEQSNAINLSGITAVKNAITLALGDTSGSQTFGAQYFAIGKATPGKVTAIAEYTVSYQ